MKRIFTLVLALLLCGAALAENTPEKEAHFPFGLTGGESLEVRAGILSGLFGDGEYMESEDLRFYTIKPERQFYDLDIISISTSGPINGKTVLALTLSGASDTDGLKHIKNLIQVLYDTYGERAEVQPVNEQVDLEGKKRIFTKEEEMTQLEEAFLQQQPFEYRLTWDNSTPSSTVTATLWVFRNNSDRVIAYLRWELDNKQ